MMEIIGLFLIVGGIGITFQGFITPNAIDNGTTTDLFKFIILMFGHDAVVAEVSSAISHSRERRSVNLILKWIGGILIIGGIDVVIVHLLFNTNPHPLWGVAIAIIGTVMIIVVRKDDDEIII